MSGRGRDDAASPRVAVYIRVGSQSASFLLPDEREAFHAYFEAREIVGLKMCGPALQQPNNEYHGGALWQESKW